MKNKKIENMTRKEIEGLAAVEANEMLETVGV